MTGARIRRATASDRIAVLRALAVAADWRNDPPARLDLTDDQILRYVESWPRSEDLGVVAEVGDEIVGAAWARCFDLHRPGYGFVADDVPELTIGVEARHRGRGIGRALLDALAEQARARGFDELSLSVETDNPARRLYERSGFTDWHRGEGAITMVLRLS